MAQDDDQPADSGTAMQNVLRIGKEMQRQMGRKRNVGTFSDDMGTTRRLRQELEAKGLQGFKKGGKVAKTGKAKVHKGEYVIKKAAADKIGPKKLASLNQANRDKKILQKTRFR